MLKLLWRSAIQLLAANPWSAGALEEARASFRAGQINEWKFRGRLRALGYTQYGIDREVAEQAEMEVTRDEGKRVSSNQGAARPRPG